MSMLRRQDGTHRFGRVGERVEAGYVMATTALMLIPMLIFAAFAVDVGSWYVEAQQIQRAADAAALAGVVWMPDENKAREAALEVTRINGFEDQVGDFDDPNAALPQVRVSRVGPQQIRIDIRAEGELYFGSVVDGFQNPRIQRFSTAEYVLPVEFGSPTNKIGFGALEIDGEPVNAWTGLMSYCQPPHYGDVRAGYYIHQSGCIEPRNSLDDGPINEKPAIISNPDTPAGRNPNHDPEGYYFVIDVPPGRATGTDIMIYDGGYCTGPANLKPQVERGSTYVEFTFWDATATPLDDSDIVQIGSTYKPGLNEGCDSWVKPVGFETPIGASGRYYVQVQNNEDYFAGFGDGTNYWSIEARDTGAPDGTTCFTFETATCVGVYARDRMPVRTQTDGDVATFYLANVEPIHEGKFLEVEMWDLGEGMQYVQFINPQGEPVDFTWRTDDTQTIAGIGAPNTDHGYETCTDRTVNGGAEPCLNVGAGGIQGKVPQWNSGGRFNGRWVTALIPLDSIPTGLDDYWWQIRYVKKSTANSADWTTWSTRVVGDPVRLIE
jgi:hypothetical protein